MLITSPQNPFIKQVIALRERKQRKRTGLMVVEGYDELALAFQCGIKPQTLLFCAALARNVDPMGVLVQSQNAGIEIIEVAERPFEKMAYRENPDGWLALVPIPRKTLNDLNLSAIPLLVVVEAVEKPGNLGAILRSADAAGVDAVILCDPTADIGNPNVLRASRGTLFSLPIAEATSEAALAWLRARAISVVAATPEATALYTETNLGAPVAIVVGTERKGLSEVWRSGANVQASIPMRGQINSLNVASATTLFLFEAVRQRMCG